MTQCLIILPAALPIFRPMRSNFSRRLRSFFFLAFSSEAMRSRTGAHVLSSSSLMKCAASSHPEPNAHLNRYEPMAVHIRKLPLHPIAMKRLMIKARGNATPNFSGFTYVQSPSAKKKARPNNVKLAPAENIAERQSKGDRERLVKTSHLNANRDKQPIVNEIIQNIGAIYHD